jgi:hypothetical protein
MEHASLNILAIWFTLACNCIYGFSGFECLCATKAMARSILGVATIEREEYSANKYNIWSCNGGDHDVT